MDHGQDASGIFDSACAPRLLRLAFLTGGRRHRHGSSARACSRRPTGRGSTWAGAVACAACTLSFMPAAALRTVDFSGIGSGIFREVVGSADTVAYRHGGLEVKVVRQNHAVELKIHYMDERKLQESPIRHLPSDPRGDSLHPRHPPASQMELPRNPFLYFVGNFIFAGVFRLVAECPARVSPPCVSMPEHPALAQPRMPRPACCHVR